MKSAPRSVPWRSILSPGNDTPRRTIRLADELWSAAQSKAAAQGTNLSEVIRRLLTEWLEEGK